MNIHDESPTGLFFDPPFPNNVHDLIEPTLGNDDYLKSLFLQSSSSDIDSALDNWNDVDCGKEQNCGSGTDGTNSDVWSLNSPGSAISATNSLFSGTSNAGDNLINDELDLTSFDHFFTASAIESEDSAVCLSRSSSESAASTQDNVFAQQVYRDGTSRVENVFLDDAKTYLPLCNSTLTQCPNYAAEYVTRNCHAAAPYPPVNVEQESTVTTTSANPARAQENDSPSSTIKGVSVITVDGSQFLLLPNAGGVVTTVNGSVMTPQMSSVVSFKPTTATVAATVCQTRAHARPSPYPPIKPKVGVRLSPRSVDASNGLYSNYSSAAASPQMSVEQPTPSTSPDSVVDAKLSEAEKMMIKRQCRMLRNREAACLSRKRKKEYVDSLEDRLNYMAAENDRLKRENEMLKKAVLSLQADQTNMKNNNIMKSDWSKSSLIPSRKSVVLLTLLLIITINLGSFWTSFYPREIKAIPVNQLDDFSGRLVGSEDYSMGRRLLFVDDAEADNKVSQSAQKSARIKRSSVNESAVPICSGFVNKTESLRLATELNSWAHRQESIRSGRYKQPGFGVDEKEAKRIAALWNNNAQRYDIRKEQQAAVGAADLTKLPPSAGGFRYSAQRYSTETKSKDDTTKRSGKQWSLEVFGGGEFKYLKFLEALHRRDDTFYVISMFRDYLLLPANSFNKTARPRMSLVMPALPLNETMQPPPHHVAMMQIECEVTATSLLHLPEALIPSFLLNERSPTSFESRQGEERQKDATNSSDRAAADNRTNVWKNNTNI